MPTYVHQNIGLFSNAAEMKRHVNRTCLLTGFKSQTGMSSFRLSCERTLSFVTMSISYDLLQRILKMHIFLI